jgi:hypothetical protein
MGYVPGCKHDLFLSYARAESAWVDAFRVALSQGVLEKLGVPPDLWQDVQSIRFGEDWPDEIVKGIRETATFLAVCSPAYFQSPWCTREYDTFAPNGSLSGLNAGSFYRLLKVIKTPDPDGLHEQFFKRLQAIEFFNKAKEEYLPGSAEFTFHVRLVASGIAELLRTMRNNKQALYLGTAPSDMQEEWSQFRTQFLDYGYDIRPRVMLTPAFEGLVEAELDRSLLAIFLLGGVDNEFVEGQIRTAKEMKRRLIVWVHPRKAKERQAELLTRVLTDAPAGSQVFGGNSIREFIQDLVDLLKPKPAVAPATSDHSGDSVYLMHDGNQAVEAGRADRLRALIREQDLTVLPDNGISLTQEMHDRFMRQCDGLLLYRGQVSGPDKWLFQNLSQVQFAEKMYDLGKPLKAKTLLLANPAQVAGLPGLDVVPYSEPFTATVLQPFFAKMRQGRQSSAGQ